MLLSFDESSNTSVPSELSSATTFDPTVLVVLFTNAPVLPMCLSFVYLFELGEVIA